MYKIGAHVTRSTPAGAAWIAKSAIVKSIDDVGPLRAAPDSAVRVFRKFWPDQDLAARNGGAWMAEQIIASLGGYNHPRLYAEIVNEWKQAIGELPLLCDRTEAAVKVLHAAGYKVAGFCFSSGNPTTMAHWDYIKGRGFCGVDLVAIHEYWANAGFSTWNALRYRRVHEYLQGQHPPFIVTECGRDAIAGEGGEGRPGWRLQSIGARQYAAELVAYSTELERDSYIIGATAYTVGPWADFAAFDLEGIAPLMPAASQAIVIPDVPIPPQGGGTMPEQFSFKLAFADYARQHPEIGKATSDISYYRPVNTEGHQLITQWAEKGKLEYNEGAGVVGFFPFA